ncbi:MAG: hypothetical protein C4320_05485 [Armatimonadota bacterium]
MQNYRNEIIWKRTTAHNDPKRFGKVTDTIFYYTKDLRQAFYRSVFGTYSANYLQSEFKPDNEGRVYKCEDLTAPYHGGEGGKYEFHGRTPGASRMWRFKKETM